MCEGECKERGAAGGVTPQFAIYAALMPGGRPRHPEVLTPAEQRVLEALRQGRTNADIAIELGLSVNTVKYHVANMLAKLDLHSRDELSAWKPRGRHLWAIATARVAFTALAAVVGAGLIAGGTLFLLHRAASDEVGGPPIVYVSPFSNTGSNLFSVEPGGPPKQLTHQGSSFVFSPVWSPDGKSLVYLNVPATNVPVKAGASSVANLTLLDTRSEEEHILDNRASTLPAVHLLQSPLWTNNGALLVFETQDFIASSIEPDGTARQDRELGCFSPALSADGKVAACVVPSPTSTAVWLLGAKGGAPSSGSTPGRMLPDSGTTSGPHFSHDGRWIAWSGLAADGQAHVFVVALDPKDPFSGDLRPADIGPGYDPRWSPAGDELVFSTGESPWMLPMIGLPAGSASRGDVFMYDTSSRMLSDLTPGKADNVSPAWSPNGKQIAFVSDNDVWVVDRDGSQRQRITSDGAPKFMLSWAPG